MEGTFSVVLSADARCVICMGSLQESPFPLAVASDLNVYCEGCIAAWIEGNHEPTSPITRRPLTRELFIEKANERCRADNAVVFDKTRARTVEKKFSVVESSELSSWRQALADELERRARAIIWESVFDSIQEACWPARTALNPWERYKYNIIKNVLYTLLPYCPITRITPIVALIETFRTYRTRLFNTTEDLCSFELLDDLPLRTQNLIAAEPDEPMDLSRSSHRQFLEDRDSVMLSPEEMAWMSVSKTDSVNLNLATEKAEQVTRLVLASDASHRRQIFAEQAMMDVGRFQSITPNILRRLQFIVFCRHLGPSAVSKEMVSHLNVEPTWRSRIGRFIDRVATSFEV